MKRKSRRSGVDYQTLADLRYHIRRFLRVRESVARAAGVEPQHYLLLLQIKGLEGRDRATVGHLAERLQLRHHSTVELVNRLAARELVARRRDGQDRREVVVALRPAGERILQRLASHSVAELQAGGPALLAALSRLIGKNGRKPPAERRGSCAAPREDLSRLARSQSRTARRSG
jgi:DNA-binding MarR family transcriptional regulator